MRESNPIDVDFVRRVLRYNARTGKLHWLKNRGPVRAGTEAGYPLKRGNILVMLGGRNYQAHRLAWAIHYGEDPVDDIDHKNGNPSDNRIRNLRKATPSQNGGNSRVSRNGLKGAYPNSTGHTWMSRIRVGSKKMYLGCFKTEQAAHEAYCKAAREHFGEFARFK